MKVNLSRGDALWLADVALAASARDDVTPVICGAHFDATADALRVTATDRFQPSAVNR